MADIIQPKKKESGILGDLGKKIVGAISNWPAEIIANAKANLAQKQAEKVGQELANKTGKSVDVSRPTGVDTSGGGQPVMTQAELEKMHADSVAKFGQKPNAPVVPIKTPSAKTPTKTDTAKTADTGAPDVGTKTDTAKTADTGAPDVGTKTGTTPQGASTSAVPSGTKTDTSSDATIPPPTAPPAGSTPEQVQAFYDANPFLYRPGESLDAYNARVTSAGGTGTTKEAVKEAGFISPADQAKIATGMKGADLSSGGSALSAFSTASAAATGDAGDSGSLQNEIEAEMDDIMTQFSTPPASQQKAYNDLLASSGLNDDQKKALDLKTIMNGTADDIRAELTNNGGFATESQIQALAQARNANLSKQFNLLQDAITTKQKWIDDQMKYMGADQQEADTQFEKKYSLINNLQSTLARLQSTDATAYYRFQTQQMSKLNTVLKYGGTLSDDQLASYAASTGIDIATLKNANESATARYSLMTAIDNANLALKQMNLSGGGGKISSSVMTSLTLHQVPPQVSQYIYQQIAQGTSLEDIRTTLANQYGKDIGYGYLDTFADVTGMNAKGEIESEITQNIAAGSKLSDLLPVYGPGTKYNIPEGTLQSLITNAPLNQ